ncbi:MAG: serine/threonine-protein phosphatase [Flavobacteriales bacterium]|nr:serine/threonine-protein phosphatase [Flavobacteriales bacterium]
MSATLKYRIAAKTDVGLVRDHNEDNFIVCPDLGAGEWRFDDSRDYAPGDKGAIWVVADGMGGTNAGEVASNIAVEHVKKTFNDLRAAGLPPADASPDVLERTLMAVNQAIAEHARKDPSSQGMGTTAVLGWLRGNRLHVSWVGDSRAYLFRKGRLRRISRDHSLVQQLVEAGTITEEQAFHHPQSNIILQSLGDGSDDLAPGHTETILQKDDLVMLCSDGLNGMVMDASMEEILHAGGALDDMAGKLIEAAKAGGGHDNITVVLARIDDAPEMKEEAAPVRVMENAHAAAAATVPTASKDGRKGKTIIVILAIVLAIALGYFLGVRNMVHGEGEAIDTTAVKELPKAPQEPVGGNKEDGSTRPGSLKETPAEEEPAQQAPEQTPSQRETAPQQTRTDRTPPSRNADPQPIQPVPVPAPADSVDSLRPDRTDPLKQPIDD